MLLSQKQSLATSNISRRCSSNITICHTSRTRYHLSVFLNYSISSFCLFSQISRQGQHMLPSLCSPLPNPSSKFLRLLSVSSCSNSLRKSAYCLELCSWFISLRASSPASEAPPLSLVDLKRLAGGGLSSIIVSRDFINFFKRQKFTSSLANSSQLANNVRIFTFSLVAILINY
ncbi:hypothetical protein FF38_00025 [Lucilia cuprina]|uniref:Uncharacterized protein n=1 Tax=Lucilia cuprina TaxID=7375 RepID=A0A0L0CIR3_LUCCU|nr:hypothetical protein FF38_00025 [Lucilia cuprina]